MGSDRPNAKPIGLPKEAEKEELAELGSSLGSCCDVKEKGVKWRSFSRQILLLTTSTYLNAVFHFDVFDVQIVNIEIFQSVGQNAFHRVTQREVGCVKEEIKVVKEGSK